MIFYSQNFINVELNMELETHYLDGTVTIYHIVKSLWLLKNVNPI